MAAAPVSLDQISASDFTEAELLAKRKLASEERLAGKRISQVTTGDFSSQVRHDKTPEQVLIDIQRLLHALNPDVYGLPDLSNRPDRTRVTFSNGNTGGTCA